MIGSTETAEEALRILRSIEVEFSNGKQKTGSGFVGNKSGLVITCAHVVSEPNAHLTRVRIDKNKHQSERYLAI